MSGTLFVVATPLGNLEDLSPRALRTLKEAGLIACEDTRHTGKLLARFDVKAHLVSFHEHNEEARGKEILESLRKGASVALVSDAGTPLISDPGYRLVRQCREEGIAVVPVPGPCAAVTALSASGLATDRFYYAGFAARKRSVLRTQLEQLKDMPCTLVFYLSPHRLGATLQEFARHFAARKACLAREMTKLHETWLFGTLETITASVEKEASRGEYTLVIEGASEDRRVPEAWDAAAYVAGLEARRGLSRSDAIKQAARELGLSKREVYQRVVRDRSREEG